MGVSTETSCIYYWQDRSQSVYSLGGASYFLSRQHDVIASFSLSKHIKTPSKLIAGPDGWALPVHWIGY